MYAAIKRIPYNIVFKEGLITKRDLPREIAYYKREYIYGSRRLATIREIKSRKKNEEEGILKDI